MDVLSGKTCIGTVLFSVLSKKSVLVLLFSVVLINRVPLLGISGVINAFSRELCWRHQTILKMIVSQLAVVLG